MSRIILCLCLLLAVSGVHAQWSINYSKRMVRQNLRTYCRQNNWSKNSIVEDAYSMTLHVNDSAYYAVSFYYHFDKRGKCYQERKITSCDTCFRKYSNEYIDRKKYEWLKLNDSVYVSKYSKKRRLELHPAELTIDFFKTSWSKDEYARLITGGR